MISLSPTERLLVHLYYREELTLREAADVIGVTADYAGSMLRSVVERTRRHLVIRNEPMKMNTWTGADLYTVGDVARIFGVSPGTVTRWIDRGLLAGFRIPGSRHRRVTRAALDRFASECQLPQWPPDDEPPPAHSAALGARAA